MIFDFLMRKKNLSFQIVTFKTLIIKGHRQGMAQPIRLGKLFKKCSYGVYREDGKMGHIV